LFLQALKTLRQAQFNFFACDCTWFFVFSSLALLLLPVVTFHYVL
jgi:hypothetical protein